MARADPHGQPGLIFTQCIARDDRLPLTPEQLRWSRHERARIPSFHPAHVGTGIHTIKVQARAGSAQRHKCGVAVPMPVRLGSLTVESSSREQLFVWEITL